MGEPVVPSFFVWPVIETTAPSSLVTPAVALSVAAAPAKVTSRPPADRALSTRSKASSSSTVESASTVTSTVCVVVVLVANVTVAPLIAVKSSPTVALPSAVFAVIETAMSTGAERSTSNVNVVVPPVPSSFDSPLIETVALSSLMMVPSPVPSAIVTS